MEVDAKTETPEKEDPKHRKEDRESSGAHDRREKFARADLAPLRLSYIAAIAIFVLSGINPIRLSRSGLIPDFIPHPSPGGEMARRKGKESCFLGRRKEE